MSSQSPELMEYMATARQEIVRTGEYPFSCGLIAIDIAEILLRSEDGPLAPEIAGLRGQPIDFMGRKTPLVPRAFEGRVRWGAHLVCVEGGLAYDPITAESIPFDAYLGEAFTVRPERSRTFKGGELQRLIGERPSMAEDIRQNAPRPIFTDLAQLRQPNA